MERYSIYYFLHLDTWNWYICIREVQYIPSCNLWKQWNSLPKFIKSIRIRQCFLFHFYRVLQFACISNCLNHQYSSLKPHFLPLFVWVPFLVLFLTPFKLFYYQQRGFVFRLLLKIIASVVIPITFPIIWGTDQLVSLFVVFQDFTYTVCYYSRGIDNANQ